MHYVYVNRVELNKMKAKFAQALGLTRRHGKLLISFNIAKFYAIIECIEIALSAGEYKITKEWKPIIIASVKCIFYVVVGIILYKVPTNKYKPICVTVILVIFILNLETYLGIKRNLIEIVSRTLLLYPFILLLIMDSAIGNRITVILTAVFMAYSAIRIALFVKLNELQSDYYYCIKYLAYSNVYFFIMIYQRTVIIKDRTSNFKKFKRSESIEEGILQIYNKLPFGIYQINSNHQIEYCNDVVISLIQEEPSTTENYEKLINDFTSQHNLLTQSSDTIIQIGKKILKASVKQIANNNPLSSLNTHIVLLTDITDITELNRKRISLAFFSTITHELRTPLNCLQGSLSLLYDHISKEGMELFSMCNKSLSNLSHMIKDTLTYARIERGTLSISYKQTNVNDLLNQLANHYSSDAKVKSISLIVSNDPAIPIMTYTDKSRIKQILMIIIANSIKYTQVGFIKVSSIFQDRDIFISVEDTGTGMSFETKANLFTLFGSSEIHLSNKQTGIGMSLALCRDIIHLIKGTLKVDSVENKGTKITIGFPYYNVPPIDNNSPHIEAKEITDGFGAFSIKRMISIKADVKPHNFNKPSSNAVNLSPKRFINIGKVLIVDDTPSNIMVLKSMLTKLKVKFDTAINGKDACEKVMLMGSSNYKVILMDINMPVMNGIEAARKINIEIKNKAIPKIYIIAVSAQSDEEIKQECEEAGITEYIEKPVSIQRLEGIMEKYNLP